MARLVLIVGFESFNLGLYQQAIATAQSRCQALDIQVFSDRDLTSQPEQVAAALDGADVFFASLIFDYDQVMWLRERAQAIPIRLVFESALELMSLTQLGKFVIGDRPKGMPKPVKFILDKFGSGREEDKLAGYISFLKIGPKLLKYLPIGKVKDLRNWLIIYGYYLSKSQNQWILITQSDSVGGSNFRADFKGNASFKADVREEKSGGLSISLRHGEDTKHVFHFWGRNRGDIDPDDVAAAFASVEARLIVGDRTKPDDRHKAKYLVSAGMDYWKSRTAKWDHFKTNGDAFIGRKRLIGSDWTTLTAHSLTPEQIYKNPPPFRGEFCQR